MGSMQTNFVNWAKKSKGLGLFWLLLWVGLISSTYLMWVDYNTSIHGYNMLPVQKYSVYEIYVVSAMPQLIQMMMGFLVVGLITVGGDQSAFKVRTIATVVFLCFAVADIVSDTWYRAGGVFNSIDILYGLFFSIVFFTFGSEMLFSFAFSMIKDLNKAGYESFKEIVLTIWEVLADAVGTVLSMVFTLVAGVAGVVTGFFINKEPKSKSSPKQQPKQQPKKQPHGGNRPPKKQPHGGNRPKMPSSPPDFDFDF